MPADKMSAYFKHNFSKKTILEGEVNLTKTGDYLDYKNDNNYLNTQKTKCPISELSFNKK